LLLDRTAGKHRLDLRPTRSGIVADPYPVSRQQPKLSLVWGPGAEISTYKTRSFLLLFFKKEALAFLYLLLAWPAKHGCRLSPA
jgi:hypothetical protein